jgi:hypothetical protein
VGFNVGLRVGMSVGNGVGFNVGLGVGLSVVGLAVGLKVGICVGDKVGLNVGLSVGPNVGDKVGLIVGLMVGPSVGNEVGFDVCCMGMGFAGFEHFPMMHFPLTHAVEDPHEAPSGRREHFPLQFEDGINGRIHRRLIGLPRLAIAANWPQLCQNANHTTPPQTLGHEHSCCSSYIVDKSTEEWSWWQGRHRGVGGGNPPPNHAVRALRCEL